MNAFATLPVLSRFSRIIDALYKAVGARTRLPLNDRRSETVLPVPLVLAVMRRLRHAEAVIRSLVTRFRAGKLKPSAPRARLAKPRARPTRPALILPRHFAWLCPLVPVDAAVSGNHLRILLEEPEMQAMIAASPRAIRILRPIYRMLGVEASVLTPPPSVAGPIGEAPSATATLNVPGPSRTAPVAPNAPASSPPSSDPPFPRRLVPE